MIATTGSAKKRAIALELGAELALDIDSADFVHEVREATGGEGVHATFDGVGKTTWDGSLRCTRRRGVIVSFGNASGPVTGVSLGALATAGSLFVTRPTLFDYYRTQEERACGAKRLWDQVRSGAVRIPVGQTYALEQAEQAHRDLEDRRTVGASLLLP